MLTGDFDSADENDNRSMQHDVKLSLVETVGAIQRGATPSDGSDEFSSDVGQEASCDRLLIEQIKRGDQTAMATLYDRYSKTVYRSALKIMRDVSAAEDVLQEVFMMIWRRPEILSDSAESFNGWMMVVARNRCYDLLRVRRRRPEESMGEILLPSPNDHGRTVELELMGEQAVRCIHELPEQTRVVVEMAFLGGMTHLQIAEQTGLPLGTIKTRIRLGLLRVRDELSERQTVVYEH
jgi:RNA polymerase sigma-70 factor (ECF subfamily)